MASDKQIIANQKNARRSTGPGAESGKRRSRRNAIRHGLTAETVIDILEDPADYRWGRGGRSLPCPGFTNRLKHWFANGFGNDGGLPCQLGQSLGGR